MNMHKLVKVLASAGIAATVVTGLQIDNEFNSNNTIQAAEKENSNTNYKYQGDTGFGDGQFLLNDAFIKTIEEDGTLAFNGHEIEASKADYEKVKEEQSEFVEENDQKFTVRGDSVTKVVFPIQDEQLEIDDIIDSYGDDYELIEHKNKSYDTYVFKLGDQEDEDEKNVIAFNVEDDYVVQTVIGYSSSY